MRRTNPSVSSTQRDSQIPLVWAEDMDKFQNGAIMCIKLKNFMTFEKITISPSSGLNLIIGPNGSGKSTIVCAIGLGLGSSASILARTSKLSGFIRHGCAQASIKILLKADVPFWICRKIKSDNSSQWRTKNYNASRWRQSTASEVLNKITELHIQLDNLCMFLPQERVKEFSTLKPPQLLTATEQAINPEVYETHQLLLKDFSKHNTMQIRINDLTQNYQRYQSALNQMRGDVIRFQQVEECKKNIEMYEKAIPWAKYQAAKQEHERYKSELRDAKQEYERVANSIRPLVQQVQEYEQKINDNNNTFTRASKRCEQKKRELLEISNTRFQVQNSMSGLKTKLDEIQKSDKQKQKEIEEKTRQIETIEEKAKDQPADADALRKQKMELTNQVSSIKRELSEVNGRRQPITRKIQQKNNKLKDIQKKINQYNNEKARLLEGIERYRPDVMQLYKHIHSKGSSFVGNIYGPICAEMKFNRPDGPNIIQMLVENYYLYSFLVEDENDRNAIDQYLKNNNLSTITILRSSPLMSQSQKHSQYSQPPPNLSHEGFNLYASDLFSAPAPVKEMLIKVAQLDRVPIGQGHMARNSVEKLSEEVFPRFNITRYITDDIVYYVRRSRYSASQSILSLKIRPSNIWREISRGTDDVKDLKEKKERTEQKIKALQDEEKAIRDEAKSNERKLSEISQEIIHITEQIKAIESLKTRIQQMKMKRDQLVRERADLPKKIEQIQNKISDLQNKRGDIEKHAFNLLKQYAKEIVPSYDSSRLQMESLQAQLEDAKSQLKYERSKHSELEQNLRDLKDKMDRQKQLRDKLKREADEKCPRTPENIAMLAELDSDVDVLNDQLQRYKTRLNQLAIIDPTIQQRYSDAEKKANDTKKELDQLTEEYETTSNVLSQRFTEWKQNMAKEVEKMNKAFKTLMETCNYRGEVHLAYEEETKLETYKLNLMVAFNRTSPLSILSSTRQSGGEKSVTTLMFLLALQDCTQFPFRVVDEINQGMDEVNDRNSFVQVMGYAMRKNQTSQYFLVTPKLLPNLEQMDGVTVMVVMNGPYVDESLTDPITFETGDDQSQVSQPQHSQQQKKKKHQQQLTQQLEDSDEGI